jgi:hypothetical protein
MAIPRIGSAFSVIGAESILDLRYLRDAPADGSTYGRNNNAWVVAAGSGTGTVTAVSIATANGFSGSSSGGATPALTITAGAIVPTSVN